MRIRSFGLTMLASMALVMSACSSGTGSTASAPASAAPNPCAGATAHSGGPHQFPTDKTKWKIGVATDVGTVNDKNFNEYTYKGAQNGATALGAAVPPVVVPKDSSEYRQEPPDVRGPGLRHHRDRRLQLRPPRRPARLMRTRTSGSSASTRVRSASTADGLPDTHIRVRGRRGHAAAELHRDQLSGRPGRLPRRNGRRLDEQERYDRRHRRHRPCADRVSATSRATSSAPSRSIRASSVESRASRRATSPRPSTTRSPARTSAQQFISRTSPTSCSRSPARPATASSTPPATPDIYGIGVDVDQALSYPNAGKCIVTSAEKKLAPGRLD